MPWLAVPYSDTKHREQLKLLLNVESLPALVFLDEHGKMISSDGVRLVYTYGADGFPFTPARIAELQAIEELKRGEQSIETLLVRNNRDYLLDPEGNKVKVSKLVGKTVGLCFAAGFNREFTRLLVADYEVLKQEGKEFEVVYISCDRDEEDCMESYSSMPWLLVPFADRPTKCQLCNYFKVKSLGSLVIIGPDGKTVTMDGNSMVRNYGAAAFPYTQEHLMEIKQDGPEI